MRLLVTGATSSLGLAVGRSIKMLYHEATGTIRTENSKVPPSIFDRLVVVDLEAPSTIEELSGNFDAVIHIAAMSRGTPEQLVRVNGESTTLLIEKAVSLGVSRFILVSGISIYGQPTVPILTAKSPIRHSSPYGAAKWIAECSLSAAQSKISGVCVRSPAIVSANLERQHHFLSRVYAQMRSGSEVCELSNPEFRFNNVIHEDTLAEFLVHLATSDKRGFDYCPVGSIPDAFLKDIVEQLADHARYKGAIKWFEPQTAPFSIELEDAIRLGFRPIRTSETIRRWLREIQSPGLS